MSVANTLYRKPWIIAILLVLLLAVWMLSGSTEQNKAGDEPQDVLAKQQSTLVRAQLSKAQSIIEEIELHGRTEAARIANLRAETEGRVIAILAERGQLVKKGDVLVRLDMQDRDKKLAQVKALLKQRELEFQGARKLSDQGYNAQTRLAEAQANLESAKVQVAQIELDISYTEIKAPFSGIFNERLIELGEYVNRGEKVGLVLDVNPIVVRGDVPELSVSQVFEGQQGIAKLITGAQYQGQVRYLSKQSNDATHTFRVELAIDNADMKIPVGVSSTVALQAQQQQAHKVSSAILSLSESGFLGIKVVDADNAVVFKPIEVIKTEADGVWVAGLDAEETIIILGQGFVREGDQVRVDLVGQAADSMAQVD